MTDIASVIGWKFSHQAGMETKDNKITAFPGGIPSQSDQDAWTAEYAVVEAAMAEITRLELQVTQRRIREATLGTDGGWLANQEALIAAERSKL